MKMQDIRVLAREQARECQTERRGRDVDELGGKNNADPVQILDVSMPVTARYKHAHFMPFCNLGLGQHANMIFDPAENGIIVFIEVKNTHDRFSASPRRSGPR